MKYKQNFQYDLSLKWLKMSFSCTTDYPHVRIPNQGLSIGFVLHFYFF